MEDARTVARSVVMAFSRPKIIGKCIYCGTTESRLTREHIIPAGLNGDWVLHAASCDACADETKLFEQDILRACLRAQRAALGMRSRSKSETPTGFPVRVDAGHGATFKMVGVAEFPVIIALPVFNETGAPPNDNAEDVPETVAFFALNIAGATEKALDLARATFEDEPETSSELRVVELDVRVNPLSFARLIAKIAHGFAVAQHGVDAFEELNVTEFIRGKKFDVRRWVGSSSELHNPGDQLHSVIVDSSNRTVRVFVRLFASLGSPEYCVVVGKLRAPAA